MSAVKEKRDWRKEPEPGDFYMTQPDYDWEPTIIPASESYGKDKQRLKFALDCDFTEVRIETYFMVWAPEEAEVEWRSDNCECEDGPHWTAPSYNAAGEVTKPPEECATTKPAEDVWDFWGESGPYCPWQRCKSSTPGAVKFRRGFIAPPKPYPAHSKEDDR